MKRKWAPHALSQLVSYAPSKAMTRIHEFSKLLELDEVPLTSARSLVLEIAAWDLFVAVDVGQRRGSVDETFRSDLLRLGAREASKIRRRHAQRKVPGRLTAVRIKEWRNIEVEEAALFFAARFTEYDACRFDPDDFDWGGFGTGSIFEVVGHHSWEAMGVNVRSRSVRSSAAIDLAMDEYLRFHNETAPRLDGI